jgi:proteic killer suppression protein
MIRSFADDETARFHASGKSRRLPPDILKRAAMRLRQLNAATRIEDLRMPPSNRLEALKGGRAGRYSIRINRQWRVCFRFAEGDAFEVEIVDYH